MPVIIVNTANILTVNVLSDKISSISGIATKLMTLYYSIVIGDMYLKSINEVLPVNFS